MDDPDDLAALTLNHLLLMGQSIPLPPGTPSKDAYHMRWHYVHLETEFWSRFMREYLPELNCCSKWSNWQQNLPRGLWPLITIITHNHYQGISGQDDAVHSIRVCTSASTFHPPVVSAIPLEVVANSD